jgi:hypothetical protein
MKTVKERGWKSTGEFIETYTISGDTKYTDSSTFVTNVATVIE